MKIAITSQGPGMDSAVDQRLGRCSYFVLVDADSEQHESIPNPSVEAPGGAGVQTAQFLIDRGVSTVLTGNVGPKAHAALDAGGVKIYTGINGTVNDALEQYQQGKLNLVSGTPPYDGNWGGGRGGGRGRGRFM